DIDLAIVDRSLTSDETATGLVAVPIGGNLSYVYEGPTPSKTAQPFLEFVEDPSNKQTVQDAVTLVEPSEPSQSPIPPSVADDQAAPPKPAATSESTSPTPSPTDNGDDVALLPSPGDSIANSGETAIKPFPWGWLALPLLGLPLLFWLRRGKNQPSESEQGIQDWTEEPSSPELPPPVPSVPAPSAKVTPSISPKNPPPAPTPTPSEPSFTPPAPNQHDYQTASVAPPVESDNKAATDTPWGLVGAGAVAAGAGLNALNQPDTTQPDSDSSEVSLDTPKISDTPVEEPVEEPVADTFPAEEKQILEEATPLETDNIPLNLAKIPDQVPDNAVDTGYSSAAIAEDCVEAVEPEEKEPEENSLESTHENLISEAEPEDDTIKPNIPLAAAGAAALAGLAAGALAQDQPVNEADGKMPAGDVEILVQGLAIEAETAETVSVQWTMPEAQKMALLTNDVYSPQVKIYDATGIDLAHQPAHSVHTYPVTEDVFEGDRASMVLPVSQCDRDYLAELGYTDDADSWISLGRSLHAYVPCPMAEPEDSSKTTSEPDPETAGITPAVGLGAVATGLAVAGLAQAGHAEAAPPDHEAVEPDVTALIPIQSLAIEPQSSDAVAVQWSMPEDQRIALLTTETYSPQLKIYDVTGIDLAYQPAHSTNSYPLTDVAFDGDIASMILPVSQCDRDYLAELGYRDDTGSWVSLGRSRHTHVACPAEIPVVSVPPEPEEVEEDTTETLGSQILPKADVPPITSAPAAPAPTVGDEGIAAPVAPFVAPFSKGKTCHQRLTIHSQAHTYTLDEQQMSVLQTTAQRISLTPGCYILTLDAKNIAADLSAPGAKEPSIILWIYGGRFINQQTNIDATSTWITLNGYTDSLTLDVLEPTNVCAFFFDTAPKTDSHQLTLLILKDE
ncbi:MAG: DUF4912 domain-containing protein, partial [Cyanobacteria bacterium P01_F01_bin.116]